MAATKMTDNVMVYPFNYLRFQPVEGKRIIREVAELAAGIQGNLKEKENGTTYEPAAKNERDKLKDKFDYEEFIFNNNLPDVNFGCIFTFREKKEGPLLAFILSFHNHAYANTVEHGFHKASKFPLQYFQKQVKHDISFLRELDILGPFAYCFQIGAHKEVSGMSTTYKTLTKRQEYCSTLLDAFERYYSRCVITQPEKEPLPSTVGTGTKDRKGKIREGRKDPRDTELDTLIYAASIHESQYRIIQLIDFRNKRAHNRHQGIMQGANFEALFLDHEVGSLGESHGGHWFRVVQIPDHPRFLRTIDYKKMRRVAKTIIPIQLNQAVNQINELISNFDAKVLWSSFFFDRKQEDGRSLLPSESHGFFKSLLEIKDEETYYELLRPLNRIMWYLKSKGAKSQEVLSITEGFKKNDAQVFFFAGDTQELRSFPNPIKLSLQESEKSVSKLYDFLALERPNKDHLTPSEKKEWLHSFVKYENDKSDDSYRARQGWIKRLNLREDEQSVIVEAIRAGDEIIDMDNENPPPVASNQFRRLLNNINNREHLTAFAYKKLNTYFELHHELYAIDKIAFPPNEDYWWCHAIMPINTSFRGDTAGMMFTFRCKAQNRYRARPRINLIANAISDALPRRLLNNIIRLQDIYSAELDTRYSISAITTRNMAHHLGSHILDNLDSESAISNLMTEEFERDFAKQMALFMGHVRTRTHLLADLTSTNPITSVSSWFNEEVLQGFRVQEIMKTFVSGTHIKRIRLKYIGPGGDPDKDILVQIPNGDLGMHAFYMLIINIIRNAAKYEDTEGMKEIVVTVKVVPAAAEMLSADKKDEHDDMTFARGFEILIYDDVNRPEEKLLDLVEDLRERLRNQQSRLGNDIKSSGWGIQEMTAAAAYLRKKGAEHSLTGSEDEVRIPLLRPEAVKDDSSGQMKNLLGYRIYLKKPRLVLIITKGLQEDQPKIEWHEAYGVRIISESEITSDLQRSFSHVFVVATYPECRDKVEDKKRFPLRWIELRQEELSEMDEYLNGPSPQDFTEYLWKKWTKKFIRNKKLYHDRYVVYNLEKDRPCPPAIYTDPFGAAIVYDHHGKHLPSSIRKEELAYYQAYGSVCPTGRVISSRRRGGGAKWKDFQLQLKEAAVTRILIIDERIQRQAQEKSKTQLKKMNGQAVDAFSKSEHKNDHFQVLRQMNIHMPDPKTGIVLDYGDQQAACIEWLKKELDGTGTDFVVLHLGLLEKWLGSGIDRIEKWVSTHVKGVDSRPEIVLISGRGRPVMFPVRFCYLPASTVAEYTVSGPPSKFHLVQMLFSSRTTLGI